MSETNNQLVPCISCSKYIAPDADFCSYCGKPQKKAEEKLPSQIKLLIMNLVCPGAGDWHLGYKLRGTIFLLLVGGALAGYCLDVVPVIQKAVEVAINTGDIEKVENIQKEIGNNGWMYLFSIAYLVSCIDSFLLLKKKQELLQKKKL